MRAHILAVGLMTAVAALSGSAGAQPIGSYGPGDQRQHSYPGNGGEQNPGYPRQYSGQGASLYSDAPEGLTGDQLVQYSNRQAAAGDKMGSVRTLERAAAMGDLAAMRGLGVAYTNPKSGIPQNPERGQHYLQEAAARGDGAAYFYLGYIYEGGGAVHQNIPLAIDYYRKSAARNFWRAELALGIDAELGVGMPRSPFEAVRWMRAAAAHTNVQTPALYADFLSRAGTRTFGSVDDLSRAFLSDYVYRHTDHTVHSAAGRGGLNYSLCSGPYALPACSGSQFRHTD